jgi:hypothetical protein
MATFPAIAAAGKSLERFLNACFSQEEPVPAKKTRAVLVRTEDLEPATFVALAARPALSVFVYRVDFNKTMRAAWSAVGSLDGQPHLPVDMHVLLTPWADNAEHEHRILGRAMQCLESSPILSGPLLHPSADWAVAEAVQVVLEDISTEALMRIFDSLPLDYKLSVAYIARVVRLDGRQARPASPVTTTVTGVVPSGG